MGKRAGRQDRAQWRASSWCSQTMGDGRAARISVAEMKSYYVYSEWCTWLLSVAEGESPGPEAAVLRVTPRAPAVATGPPREGFSASALQKEDDLVSHQRAVPPEQGAPRQWGGRQTTLHLKSSFDDSEAHQWLPKARDIPVAREAGLNWTAGSLASAKPVRAEPTSFELCGQRSTRKVCAEQKPQRLGTHNPLHAVTRG